MEVDASADERAHAVLREAFGYPSFRGGQLEVIREVLAGRDCLAIMPTGAGKSLTFQVPARVLGGTTLVVSPLIALMKDQVDALVRRGFSATLVNSTLPPAERDARLARVAEGGFELVYAAPEGMTGRLLEALRAAPVRLVAVDEAHCISEWGYDFRPDYRRLGAVRESLGTPPLLAVTATATPEVADDIVTELRMRDPLVFRGSFLRDNLRIACVPKRDRRSVRADVLSVLRVHDGEAGIVYCLSRRSADTLAAFLARHGVDVAVYHAGMDAEERAATQERFASGEVRVVVATVAFGMGIDRADVRFVVHRDLPAGIEAYYQEIGRGGRDGLPADCVLFHSWDDVRVRDRMARPLPPDRRRHAMRQARALYRLVAGQSCRHRTVCAHFGEEIAACKDACDVCAPELSRRVRRACTAVQAPSLDAAARERVAAAVRVAGLVE